jgi:hypothetical protein
VRSSTTSLAGDSGGQYNSYEAICTDGGGSAVHVVLKVGAGFDAYLDLSACATGEGDVILGDNLASAWQLREAATAYLTAVTTNSAERISFGKLLALGNGGFSSPAALSGNATLDHTSAHFQRFDAGASNRDVTLPAIASGLWFCISNVGGSNNIVVKNAGGSTIVTLAPSRQAWVVSDAAVWQAQGIVTIA